MQWRKSSFSGGTGNGNCVEVAWPTSTVAVRDSKNPSPSLDFPRPHWRAFLTHGETTTSAPTI